MNCLHLSKIQDSFRETEKVSEDINQKNINNAERPEKAVYSQKYTIFYSHQQYLSFIPKFQSG